MFFVSKRSKLAVVILTSGLLCASLTTMCQKNQNAQNNSLLQTEDRGQTEG